MQPSTFAAIQFNARQNPQAIAVLAEAGPITYRELAQHIDRVTQRLAALQFPGGSRVAVQLQDGYFSLVVLVALGRIGCTGCVMSQPADGEALAPAAIVTDVRSDWKGPTVPADATWYEQPPPGLPPFDEPPHADDGLAQIILSSGTTGRPKLVPVPYRSLLGRLRNLALQNHFTPATRLLCLFGLSTAGGTLLPLACWTAGGALVMSAGATRPVLRLLRQRPNVLYASALQLERLLEGIAPDFVPPNDLRVFVGGSALPRDTGLRARLRLSPSLYTVLGSTEANTIALGPAAHADSRPGFTGYVTPTIEAQVVDAQRAPVPAGVEGELRVRSEWMATHYLDDAAASAEAFRDGWFHPGDLAILGGNGEISITGRVRERMNFGGVKVAPERIEEAMSGLANASDLAAATMNLPNGELHCLAVVASGPLDKADIQRRFAGAFPELARHKLAVRRVAAVPRNEMGKVMRAHLGQALAAAEKPPTA